ncbi:putative uncharacterized protein DDB_G0291812 isoform X2 [Osmia bicornis bicornis]|uniref:putative uncharacterized protein DDB_G0291812 isoform X2 n=1 Tax=Osmia bicornis bicornis TaxID=1437191 RepID=UPI001EAF1477|nr:putative uncharacterized protein DDB_G0291812 isoform X2 [Osmia bicornis bicornis]
MCDHKNRLQKEYYTVHKNLIMHSDRKKEASIVGSQNFCLKWSQDSIVCDTQDVVTPNGKDVIVISDSSSRSTSSSPICFSSSKSTLRKQSNGSTEVYILESSDSDFLEEENKKIFQAWRANKKPNFITCNQQRKDVKKDTAFYTSDESASNSPNHCKNYIENSDKISSIESISKDISKNVLKSNVELHGNVINEVNPSPNCAGSISIRSKQKILEYNDTPTKGLSSKNKTDNDFMKNFSRKDYQRIIKNIKFAQVVYESPRNVKKHDVILNEGLDGCLHPAISPKNNEEISNKIIDETPVDSEGDIIYSSQTNLANIYKTPLNRILDKQDMNNDEGMMCTELSERKKRQISQWLMSTSPNSQNDTSLSLVPPSNKDDLSSGHSSLERLEMNYETPNNRGKIKHNPISENRVISSDYSKKTNSTTLKQPTLKKFIQSKNDTPKLCTSRNNCNNNVTPSTLIPTENTPQNLDITDCVDILDKLYGKTWRAKADVLFPNSEPRKPVVPTKNRAVQTERKPKSKRRCNLTDSEDDSDTSIKDLRLQKRLTKKSGRKNTKQIDSFINDQLSSGSESESLYYTALTNPKLSVNSTQKKPTCLDSIQKVIGICDPDTETENNTNDHDQIHDIRRRKLSFSNDEIEDSSTSEFDPGDDVPPKSITKRGPAKTPREIPKTTIKSKQAFDNQKYEKHHSFLASLSESVPITSAHPDAKKYRLNFKNAKEELCNYLFKLYNEKVFDKKLPKDMTIEWNVRMRGTAGFCYNKKSIKTLGGVVKSSRIVLAIKILDTPDRLRDTLIHEMCHAAAWLINDVSDGHGPFWTGWANKAMNTFPELPPIRRCHDYKIKTKFTYKCMDCGYSIGRHSKSLDIEKKRCGHCYGKFELLINKTTKSGTVQVQTPQRGPSAFALYVKENYNSVKKKHNIRHPEIMKILGIGI